MRLAALPAVGQTVGGGAFMQAWGGKGANQAVAAARAGGRVTFIACVGDDAPGRAMLEEFRQDDIDVSRAKIAPDCATGSAMILCDARGENLIAVAPGANARLSADDVDQNAEVIAAAGMLILQMEVPAATNARALELARQHGVPVLFNYAPVHPRDLPVTLAMSVLVVNETEASGLVDAPVTGVDSAFAAARTLRRQGPHLVVVTLGRHGACAVSDAGELHTPALPVTAVDSTAAGDTFCGALAVALVEQQPLGEALRFATAAAAICVTRRGAQPSIPTRQQIVAMRCPPRTPGPPPVRRRLWGLRMRPAARRVAGVTGWR
jgi:ribokinase